MESTDSSSGCQQLQLPPGFRFHPTDEELVVHYLKRKAASTPLPVAIIAEIDLYKFDPWELPGKANFGEHEWYFFSPRDRKYPNGARPNRAATSGYWKATGTDKPILTSSASAGGGVVGGGSAGSNHHQMKVGVKKALVFYGGKPPKGIKTNWIMHEYRLTDTTTTSKPPQHGRHDSTNGKKASLRLDDWVLCRIYKKNSSSTISNCTSTQMRVVMGREGDVEPFMDHHQSNNNNMLSAAAPACVSLPIHHPPAGTVGISRHTTTGTCKYTTLLENDDTFFQGLLSTNTSTHGNADDDDDVQDGIVHATSTTTIQLGTSAAAANTQSSKAEPHCLVSPTFQGNKLPQATSPYGWYVNASTGTIDLNPQLPPSKRFHAYNGGGGGAGSSNSNNSTTNVTNNNINTSGTNSNNTDDGAGHNTIETMLHQQSIPAHGSTVPPNFVSHHLRRRRHENNSLGSLLLHGDGTSGSVLGQAYQQPTIWRSS